MGGDYLGIGPLYLVCILISYNTFILPTNIYGGLFCIVSHII